MARISAFLVVLALVAACGGAGASPTPSGAAATVSVGTTSLGSVLVGPNGHTLYGLTTDQTAGKPTCTAACSTNWPPQTVTGDFTVGSGLVKANFTLVARDDGSMQLETGGFPLYEFAADVNATDTNGQGVGGKWFAMGSNGTRIGAPAASASSAVSAMPSAAASAAPTAAATGAATVAPYIKPTPAPTY